MDKEKKVSIIISNRNDIAMLIVTIRSVIEELKPLGLSSCEIVIVDNSDEPLYELLTSALPTGYIREGLLKVLRQPFPCLFSARETAVDNSLGRYILCVDSHMLIGRDLILDLYNFMESKKDDPTVGFAHAPINWAHQHHSRARHDRNMIKNELGDWGAAHSIARPITWKGMPWICRRHWFRDTLGGYGALSHHHLSWGGGDMHIGIKPWLLGYVNWAVPTSPGIHIGPFPKLDQAKDKNSAIVGQDRYRLWSVSGEGPHALGFLVSCYVLGGEPMMERNKDMIISRFGRYIDVEANWEKAKELGKDEKAWLDSRKVTTFEQLLIDSPWNV
jgi:hypothetical protein